MGRWPSGRRRMLGKHVSGNVSGVRIPLFPSNSNLESWIYLCACKLNPNSQYIPSEFQVEVKKNTY